MQKLRVVREDLGEEPDLSEVDRGDAGDDPAEQRAAVEEGVFGELAGLQKSVAVRPLLEPLVSVGWNGEDGLEGRLNGERARASKDRSEVGGDGKLSELSLEKVGEGVGEVGGEACGCLGGGVELSLRSEVLRLGGSERQLRTLPM